MPELTEREERRLRAALELIGDAAAHPDPVRPVRRAPLAWRRTGDSHSPAPHCWARQPCARSC